MPSTVTHGSLEGRWGGLETPSCLRPRTWGARTAQGLPDGRAYVCGHTCVLPCAEAHADPWTSREGQFASGNSPRQLPTRPSQEFQELTPFVATRSHFQRIFIPLSAVNTLSFEGSGPAQAHGGQGGASEPQRMCWKPKLHPQLKPPPTRSFLWLPTAAGRR